MNLPGSICFRVTRFCNARCGFCLAPPDGSHPDGAVLSHRLDWLLAHGVKTIHFCGGEPTIHPAIGQLVEHVHRQGAKTLLTTNGIVLPDGLLSVVRTSGTGVKVSLHGDREHHDKIVGRPAFEAATNNLRRLVEAGVRPSVQTTIVSGGEWVAAWMADFCRSTGVTRLNILPFIPRGSGYGRRSEYELTTNQRNALQKSVREMRRALSGRLDVRWLDFTAQPVPVAEADGRVVLEGATEALDRVLCKIPEPVL
jgi:MoaA/NifB/PqqE/SkfB family radical SAM enzyme